MTDFPKTPRNRVKRLPKRAEYDREAVYAVVDSAPICHVGFVQDGQPFVLPTIDARMDDALIIHGSTASRMMKQLGSGAELCVTMTHLDGLVLARSAFHHSMNYRSAVLFGRGEYHQGPGREAGGTRSRVRAPGAGPVGGCAPADGAGVEGDYGGADADRIGVRKDAVGRPDRR